MRLAIVMLAAGNSCRFGTNKLMYKINGRSMYLWTLEKVRRAAAVIPESEIVVVTQYDEIAKTVIEMNIPVFINPHPEDGISLSLKIGLKCVSDTDACLFTVADQPWLTENTIVELIELFKREKKGMACTIQNGKTGNPCIFSQKYYQELCKISGDRGGKVLIKKYPEDVAYLEVRNARELQDVDVPEALF